MCSVALNEYPENDGAAGKFFGVCTMHVGVAQVLMCEKLGYLGLSRHVVALITLSSSTEQYVSFFVSAPCMLASLKAA